MQSLKKIHAWAQMKVPLCKLKKYYTNKSSPKLFVQELINLSVTSSNHNPAGAQR